MPENGQIEIEREKREIERAPCVFHRLQFTCMNKLYISSLHLFLLVLLFYSIFCRFVSVQTIKCNNNRSRNEICINLFSIGKIEEACSMHNWIFFPLATTCKRGGLLGTGKKLILIEHVRTGT